MRLTTLQLCWISKLEKIPHTTRHTPQQFQLWTMSSFHQKLLANTMGLKNHNFQCRMVSRLSKLEKSTEIDSRKSLCIYWTYIGRKKCRSVSSLLNEALPLMSIAAWPIVHIQSGSLQKCNESCQLLLSALIHALVTLLWLNCSNNISITLSDTSITSVAVLGVENGAYNCTITSANSINSTSALTNTVQVTDAANTCTSKSLGN